MEFAELIVRWRLPRALAWRLDLVTVATAAAKVGVAGWLYRMTVRALANGDHLAFSERNDRAGHTFRSNTLKCSFTVGFATWAVRALKMGLVALVFVGLDVVAGKVLAGFLRHVVGAEVLGQAHEEFDVKLGCLAVVL